MKKSAVIATCLMNGDFFFEHEQAEEAVRQVFAREYPNDDFNRWNQPIDERTAEKLIKSVGRASSINVRSFIKDLWDVR